MSNPFIIRKQHSRNGCIPACALSVLDFLQIQHALDETTVQRKMITSGFGLGFAGLKAALTQLKVPVKVSIDHPKEEDLEAKLDSLIRQGKPVLFPKTTPQGPHCVVISSLEAGSALVHDPGTGSTTKEPLPSLKEEWTLSQDVVTFDPCEAVEGASRGVPSAAIFPPKTNPSDL